MTASEIFKQIAAATVDYPEPLDEAFIRGLAARSLGLPGRDPIANDQQVVEWWAFARVQYREVHRELDREPTDRETIGGQLFADRMSGD